MNVYRITNGESYADYAAWIVLAKTAEHAIELFKSRQEANTVEVMQHGFLLVWYFGRSIISSQKYTLDCLGSVEAGVYA